MGIDTIEHIYKPGSEIYFNCLTFIDNGVKEIVSIYNNFFEDNATTFNFTFDHGMTNWGSHGSGSEHETGTPFIAFIVD